MARTAEAALAAAKKGGAGEAMVRMNRSRFVDVSFRDGKLEKATSSTRVGLGLTLFVDGRFGVHSTSDLRPGPLGDFTARAVEMTRLLEPDPLRSLPEAARMARPPAPDLDLHDPALAETPPQYWVDLARDMEVRAAKAAGGLGPKLVSVQGGAYAETSLSLLADSRGFMGSQEETGGFAGCTAVLMDPGRDGVRRMAGWWEGERALAPLRSERRLAGIAETAARRALDRMGARPGPSGLYPVVVENQAARTLVGRLLGCLDGRVLHQKRSYLSDYLGKPAAAPLLRLEDQPLMPGGFGSRWYDDEGAAAKPLTLFEGGVLKNFYLDAYHARALDMKPTVASSSNLVMPAAHKLDFEGLAAGLDQGLAVTGFLGGNFNSTTGDFSLGVQGRWVKGGKTAHPVENMNMAGNYRELWNALAGVGDDPYPFAALRTPSLLFGPVRLAGV
jgi:PmbA protein